jgi:hypothetical protein
MPLPEPAPRQDIHTRSVTYRGFLREDGLWDIEGEMADIKAYEFDMVERGQITPGTPIHGMSIRVTVDDKMKIHAIAASMDFTPFGECSRGEDPMRRMVGVTMGPGWRQAIERELGGIKGCTHLRELLFNLATAAYQTVFPYRDRERQLAGVPTTDTKEPPYHLGRCIAWDFEGPIVARAYPQFKGWQPLKRAK